jgi:uncharacterized protein
MSDGADVANLVRDAGGRIVGRTRLQKVAYVLEATGLGDGFKFKYQRFGPFSDGVAASARNAAALGLITQVEKEASWGGSFSVFTTRDRAPHSTAKARVELARLAAKADAIELELAATALFLSLHGEKDPWEETARRKPDKADRGRLERAKALYAQMRQIRTPKSLPKL